MPEFDFDKIARSITDQSSKYSLPAESVKSLELNISNALHHVWNARGKADIQAISGMPAYRSDVADRPFENGVAEGRTESCQSIRSLDR